VEGSFACPECGMTVELTGLAPGRQVRCGFCHRLLEVPYLPRADVRWKRQRFSKPKWVFCAWAGSLVAAVLIGGAGAIRFVKKQYHSVQERSVRQLIESSHKQEANGELSQALIDLDAALDLATKVNPAILARIDREQKRRPELARREAESVLSRLSAAESSSFSAGEWLNLTARVQRDRDLASLAAPIRAQFQTAARQRAESELAAARAAIETGQPAAALSHCDYLAGLFTHLRDDDQARIHDITQKMVKHVVAIHGVNIMPPTGEFVFGSLTNYLAELVPTLKNGLQIKGYVARPETSSWRELWKDARWRLQLTIRERMEGSYLSSANRLCRIEADLELTAGDVVAWRTVPTARSTVPLPRLPAGLAARIASTTERSKEFEKLLYADARAQIDEKFGYALQNMPVCPTASLVK
jgi:hypothetical protein